MKKLIILPCLAVFMLGCTTTKIYQTSAITCTWQTVEQLIICKEDYKP